MSLEEDRETLLDALYERHLATGKRPSVVEAQMNYLPEWNRDRLFDAAQALESLGDILNPTGAIVYVDLSSEARKRAIARRNASAAGSPPSRYEPIITSPSAMTMPFGAVEPHRRLSVDLGRSEQRRDRRQPHVVELTQHVGSDIATKTAAAEATLLHGRGKGLAAEPAHLHVAS